MRACMTSRSASHACMHDVMICPPCVPMQDYFIKYYDAVMPQLKAMLLSANVSPASPHAGRAGPSFLTFFQAIPALRAAGGGVADPQSLQIEWSPRAAP